MTKQWKRWTAIILMMVMLVPYMAHAQEPAAAGGFTDIKGHWAEETILKWAGFGLVKGQSADRFNPNAPITRAELAALINNVAEVEGEAAISFTDVAPGTWYYIEVAKAMEAGYMQGYADGTFKPTAPTTRQELAVLITRLLGMDEQEPDASYADVANAPAWSKGAIGTVIQAGIMSGTAPGRFAPLSSTTRAEALVTLDRIADMGNYVPGLPPLTVTYDEAGTYGGTEQETVEGAVIISAADVVLRNTTIAGDLTIAASVGEGDVTLQGVVVQGRTLIQGGGENSIRFKDSTLGQVEVNKAGGKIRVVFDETSKADRVRLQSPAKVEAAEGSGVGEVELGERLSSGSEIVLDGSFARIVVSSEGSNITADNGTIGTFQVNKQAKGSKVSLGKNSKVTQLTLDSGTSVTGDGTVDKASINAEGTTLAKKPGEVAVADGIQASVGGSTVSGKGTTAPPAAGGGAIGGGGGGFPNPGTPGGGVSGPFTVTGEVIQENGQRLDGLYYYSIYDRKNDDFISGEVANGQFRLSLSEGEYRIGGVYQITLDGSVVNRKWIDHTFQVSSTSVKQLSLIAYEPNLHGEVEYPNDLEEKEYYLLFLSDKNNASSPSTLIYSETTSFSTYVKDGEYSISFYSEAVEDFLHVGDITVKGQTQVALKIPAITKGIVIMDDQPLTGGHLDFIDVAGYQRSVPIDDNGEFQARLSDGEYTDVRVLYTDDAGMDKVMHIGAFVIEADGNSGPVKFELRSYRLRGTLLDEKGEAVNGTIKLTSTNSSQILEVINGTFKSDSLENGDYSILYSDAKGNRFPIEGIVSLTGDHPQTVSLVKKINVRGTFIKGDTPLDGVTFIIQQYQAPVSPPFIPAPQPVDGEAKVYVEKGAFEFFLPPNEYVIKSYQSGNQTINLREPLRFTVSEELSELAIQLPVPNFTGILYDVDGITPLDSGLIVARRYDPVFMPYSSIIVNGKYELDLADGEYEVMVWPQDKYVHVSERLKILNGQPDQNPFDQWSLPPVASLNLSLTGAVESEHFRVLIAIPENRGTSYYEVKNGQLSLHIKPGTYTIVGYELNPGDEPVRLATPIQFEIPGNTTIAIPTF
ncbi:S-layer homology domain-containing protein [Paenibacillus sp. 1P07SE]|uniref:S-layer homology domain-containing protein n=1 Tax=Paenibacillus sp. 1P07SE TaxID=3132209 RepID=UPI0039A49854